MTLRREQTKKIELAKDDDVHKLVKRSHNAYSKSGTQMSSCENWETSTNLKGDKKVLKPNTVVEMIDKNKDKVFATYGDL